MAAWLAQFPDLKTIYSCNGAMAATVAQDPANIGATALQILVDAVANPGNYPASAAPEKTPVDAILVNE